MTHSNPINIYIVGEFLSFEGDELASKEQYELADRCVGSIFEALEPGETIRLSTGHYVLDEHLDLILFWRLNKYYEDGQYCVSRWELV